MRHFHFFCFLVLLRAPVGAQILDSIHIQLPLGYGRATIIDTTGRTILYSNARNELVVVNLVSGVYQKRMLEPLVERPYRNSLEPVAINGQTATFWLNNTHQFLEIDLTTDSARISNRKLVRGGYESSSRPVLLPNGHFLRPINNFGKNNRLVLYEGWATRSLKHRRRRHVIHNPLPAWDSLGTLLAFGQLINDSLTAYTSFHLDKILFYNYISRKYHHISAPVPELPVGWQRPEAYHNGMQGIYDAVTLGSVGGLAYHPATRQLIRLVRLPAPDSLVQAAFRGINLRDFDNTCPAPRNPTEMTWQDTLVASQPVFLETLDWATGRRTGWVQVPHNTSIVGPDPRTSAVWLMQPPNIHRPTTMLYKFALPE